MSEPTDYSVAQKVIHWVMAFFIMVDLFVAQKFGDVMEDWDRLESRADHASLGTIVAVLLVIRIALRFRHGAPPMPAGMSRWQLWAAKAAHGLLYFLIAFLVLSGLATAVNATSPIALFGALDITTGQTDDATFVFLRQFHEYATNTMIALIVVHLLAVLYHQFIAKDDSTRKMLRFWRST